MAEEPQVAAHEGPRGHGEHTDLRRSLGFRDLVVYGLLFIAPMAPVGVFGTLDAKSHGPSHGVRRGHGRHGLHPVPQVVQAVKELDAHEDVDVIIVARGGGSVEDLLPFSDEQLVRAVADCRTPVVSAIGHEPDSPLLDLVADLRASTPTDAAKKVVPDVGEELDRVRGLRDRALRTVRGLLEREERGLAHALGRPVMEHPQRMVEVREDEVDALLARSRRVLGHLLDRADSELSHTRARVRALSPAATMERGYAVLQRADGSVVRAPEEVAEGEELRARVAEGEFAVRRVDAGAGPGGAGPA
ncbi:Exodeoxyribonuclease 7 large subunit [Streptomyces narbonensis]